jgi:hypothetical protein
MKSVNEKTGLQRNQEKEIQKKKKNPSKFNLEHKLEWYKGTDENNNYSHHSSDSIGLCKIIAHLKKRAIPATNS